jgi:hypothetical protein
MNPKYGSALYLRRPSLPLIGVAYIASVAYVVHRQNYKIALFNMRLMRCLHVTISRWIFERVKAAYEAEVMFDST